MNTAGARSGLRSKIAKRNKVRYNSNGNRIDSDPDSDTGVINGRRITKETQTVKCQLCLKDIVVQAGKSLPAVVNGHKSKCRGPPKGPENGIDAEHDICRGDNDRLSNILNRKGIRNWLDVRPFASHDWPVWKEMFPHYLSTIK